jgi:hypothetical protein
MKTRNSGCHCTPSRKPRAGPRPPGHDAVEVAPGHDAGAADAVDRLVVQAVDHARPRPEQSCSRVPGSMCSVFSGSTVQRFEVLLRREASSWNSVPPQAHVQQLRAAADAQQRHAPAQAPRR